MNENLPSEIFIDSFQNIFDDWKTGLIYISLL